MIVDLRLGDCLEVLKTIPDNSVDSVVTDPPYHLTSIVKRFGKEDSAPAQFGTDGAYARASKGFMGKEWDGGDIAFRTDVWEECLRILKPGGHLLAFSHSRTYHRMGVAIEDAGFEIRDQIMWVYGQGFPKSHNISKSLSKLADEKERTEQNIQHDLRCVPDSNLQETELIDEEQDKMLFSHLPKQDLERILQNEKFRSESKERISWREQPVLEGGNNLQETEGELQGSKIHQMSERIYGDGEERWIHNGTSVSDGTTSQQITNENGGSPSHRPQPIKQSNTKSNVVSEQLTSQEIREIRERFDGYGTALKPAHEPIVMARKPLSEKSIAENVLKHGTGGINIDGSRIGTSESEKVKTEGHIRKGNVIGDERTSVAAGQFGDGAFVAGTDLTNGRFPANIIFDEEAGQLLDEQAPLTGSAFKAKRKKDVEGGSGASLMRAHKEGEDNGYRDERGGASRFFYCPKAAKKDRNDGTNELYLIENNLLCEIETLNELLKDTSVDMINIQDEQEWNTISFGNNITEQYQMDFKSITSIILKMIIGLKTLNYLPHLSIKDYIVDVIKMINKSGLNLVDYVEFINQLKQNIINEVWEYRLGVVNVVLPTLLKIKEKGRTGNFHATVKPTDLMRYLINLVTPPNGTILDPFMGSGSTGKAAVRCGVNFIGIEKEQEYMNIASARIEHERNKPTQTKLF